MRKWIQQARISRHKGSLRQQLGIKSDRKIPSKLLTEISSARIGTRVRGHTVTPLLKKRVVLARTLRRLR